MLSVRDLKTYFSVRGFGRSAHVRAVDGVSFDIAQGETLGLVGESGCGKTTVARSILRLVEPTGGLIVFGGVDVLSAKPRARRSLRRDMQAVFQDPVGSLNPRMKVGSIVAEPLEIHGVGDRNSRRKRVTDLLTRVGLRAADADHYPHEFSGGQRQRIGIARAIALSPKFIVLDEPVSALDVSVQAQVLNLLSDLKDELGLTYLFIAHNLAVVEHFSDRVAVMYLGKIVEAGPAEEVYAQPLHPYTMALLSAVPGSPGSNLRAPHAPGGEPPSPLSPPSGCAFHPRCPHAVQDCRQMPPPLAPCPGKPVSRLVACLRAAEIAAPADKKLDNAL